MKKSQLRNWKIPDVESLKNLAFIVMLVALLLKLCGVFVASGWIIYAIYVVIAVGMDCSRGKWTDNGWVTFGVVIINALGLCPHPWLAYFGGIGIDSLMAIAFDGYMANAKKGLK